MAEIVGVVIQVIGLLVVYIFSDMVDCILKKDKRWFRYFLIWMGILIFQTVYFSLLPSQFGIITYYEELDVTYEDGALIRNFGIQLIFHALGMIVAVVKYLWSVARKKAKLDVRFLLLEAAICSICIYISIQLIQIEDVIHFEKGDIYAIALMVVFGFIGFISIFFEIQDIRSRQEPNQESTDNSEANSQSGTKIPSKETIARFEEVVAEKERLTEIGDYASQIFLLNEATGLDLDPTRKSKIWNYLGIAHTELNSEDNAAECFRTAQRIDPGHPSSYLNLAMYYTDKKEYKTALKNAEIAIKKAQIRKFSMGVFYANYAKILGISGNLSKAKDNLRLAEEAGYDKNAIISIKKQLGIS